MKEFIKSLLADFDPAALIPELDVLLGGLEPILRVLVLAGPLSLLGLGMWYLLLPTKEANHSVGYRFYWGMSSVESWQFSQKLAGAVWSALGFVLTIVMSGVCNGYRELGAEAMVWSALGCLGWEVALIVLSVIAINVTVMLRFNTKGYERGKLQMPAFVKKFLDNRT